MSPTPSLVTNTKNPDLRDDTVGVTSEARGQPAYVDAFLQPAISLELHQTSLGINHHESFDLASEGTMRHAEPHKV
jgi:hypothetical protein